MSRLDYVTIGIVVVCVAALAYLIYMTTNLLGGDGEEDVTPITEQPSEYDAAEDDAYYYDDDEATVEVDSSEYDYEEDAGYDYDQGEDLDKGRSTSYEDEAASSVTMTTTEPSTTSSYGSYLVIAGTFSVQSNADDRVSKLRGMGYNNAQVSPFNRGAYSVALVDRFDSYSSAKALADELEGKGFDAIVQEKR